MCFVENVKTIFEISDNIRSSIIFTHKIADATNNEECFALYKAQKYGASAVYFRYLNIKNVLNDEKDIPTPLAYIYDNTNNAFSEQDIAEIHRKLWNSEIVFLYIVIEKETVRFYNPRKPVSVDENQNENIVAIPLTESLKITADIVQKLNDLKLSSQYLSSPLFVEHFQKDEFLEENSPYYILLNRLKYTRDNLIAEKNFTLSKKMLNKLLVMLILVKYLEEKKDENDISIVDIDKNLWKKFNVESVTEILRKGKIIDFLEKLNSKFEGNVFYLSKERIENESYSEEEEIQKITKTHLNLIADYFDADVNPENKTKFIWRQYDFNHLPIELISGIYEAFLTNKTSDIAYTPPYLVNLLIDEAMPLDKAQDFFGKQKFKVFDPSCGSGIFLVSAYKRMIEWQIMLNYQESEEGEWKIPSIGVLKKILKNNIFGTDIHKGAQEIAVFSCAIALCQFLSPIKIWNSLKFDDLGENNILHSDYFIFWNKNKETTKFDLIIGNPPFENLGKEHYQKLLNTYELEPVPGPQIAFLFLNTANDLLKKNGKLSLILPSQFLYNQAQVALDFQKKFLENHCVEQIYDFSLLRRVLFKKKKTKAKKSKDSQAAVCALILRNKNIPKRHKLIHTVFQRLLQHEKKTYFEADYYDIHHIRYDIACNEPFIWKCNLMGGGRLYHFLKILKDEYSETFGDFLKKKQKEENWKVGEGYKKVSEQQKKEGIDYVIKKYGKNTADYITNFNYVENKDFVLQDGKSLIKTAQEEQDTYFETPVRNGKQIFYTPHIIIRKHPTLPILFLEEDLRFKNGIVGIHAPKTEENIKALKGIVEKFNTYRDFFRFYIFATSNRTIRYDKYSILKKDIMNLPYITADFFINTTEKWIINDVLSFYSEANKKSSENKLNEPAELKHLKEYAKTFCFILNTIYKNKTFKYRLGEIQQTHLYYIVSFHYGKTMPKNTGKLSTIQDDLDESLKVFIENNLGESYKLHRLLKYYKHENGDDIVYFIKAKQKRYWLNSIAIKDADGVLSDLIKAGH
ncbi:MAG: HsdM family class I SAM-dependent methyltransferase [Chitinophagales bacterium]